MMAAKKNSFSDNFETERYHETLAGREEKSVELANRTSDNMISFMGMASAIFTGLLSTGWSDYSDSVLAKIICFVTICAFSLSTVFGVIYFLISHKHHYTSAKDFNTISNDLRLDERGQDDSAYDRAIELQEKHKIPTEAGEWARTFQAILFIIGVITTLVYVSVLMLLPVPQNKESIRGFEEIRCSEVISEEA